MEQSDVGKLWEIIDEVMVDPDFEIIERYSVDWDAMDWDSIA